MAEPRDDELAAELRALGEWLETPEPPDVRAAVRARLAAAPQPTVRARLAAVPEPTVRAGRRRPPWRWLPLSQPPRRRWLSQPPRRRWLSWPPRRWRVVAAAVALAVIVAVLPPGRAAVAHAVSGLLRFAGVEVHRGQPAVPASPSPLPSIRSAALDEARRSARFPVRVPDRLGVPDDALLADPAPDGAPRVVSLLYRRGTIRLDAFDGQLEPGFIKTAAGPDAEWVQVKGDIALWFPAPHALVYVDRQGVRREETARLAAPTLIWAEGLVTYRLEGAPSRDEAIAIASSLR